MIYKKTAHYTLDSLADTVSRYNAFEKEADYEGMEEMAKEAKNLVETLSEATGKASKVIRNSKTIKGIGEGIDRAKATKAGRVISDNLNSLRETKTYERIAPTASAAWKGAVNGAFLGAVKGSLSDYRDKEDGKVHRGRNILHDAKRGAIIGAATGIGKKEFLDKKYIPKTAHEELDEMVKQAFPMAGAIGSFVAAKPALKKLPQTLSGVTGAVKQGFSGAGKVLKGTDGVINTMKTNGVMNTMKNAAKAVDWKGVVTAGKNIDLKPIGKLATRAITGYAVGETLAGAAKGAKDAISGNNYEGNMFS